MSELNHSSEVISHVDRAKSNLLQYIESKIKGIDTELIGKAVQFSIMAHKNQYRKSGMPYVDHPFEVAKLLADFNMDHTTIVAGLLHDVIEDTAVTKEELEAEFGAEVAFLVEGVTKISEIQSKSRIDQQAETFRKMLMSMAKDFRVILIKFADRLHNMRTMKYMKDEKKRAISAETLEVYAPLAHRFGLARIRWELEDLSFRYLNPDSYKFIVEKVVEKRNEREDYIRSLVPHIKNALMEAGIDGKVYGRPKHLYSIHKKLESRNCKFEDLYDLFALRVILKSVEDCYAALGIVHQLWIPLQTRFKDFIAAPKSNMYQSLHTTLIGPQGKPVEIQIRTQDMELTAEYGIAAHWAYKEGKAPKKVKNESEWLSQFMEWQQDIKDSAEFMDFFRIDLKTEDIYVFTPKGDLITLPKGATALDFAFAVHSEVGEHCIGAKVEGSVVPLGKVLQTGVTVEILKSPSQTPSRDWLRMAITLKAKNRIRRFLKNEMRDKSILLGKELIHREFQALKIPELEQKDFSIFAEKFDVESWDDLYFHVGNGDITSGAISAQLKKIAPSQSKGMFPRVRFKKAPDQKIAVLVSGMGDMLIRFASCCQPLPGDEIMGYVTKGRGVSIHRSNCPDGQSLLKQNKDRIVPVAWKTEADQKYDIFLEVLAKDKPGLLSEITQVFLACGVNVDRATIATSKGQVRNRFKVQVTNLPQLEHSFKELKKIKEVRSITRKNPNTGLEEEVDLDSLS